MVVTIITDPDNINDAVKKFLTKVSLKSAEQGIKDVGPKIKALIEGRSPVGDSLKAGLFKTSWSRLKKIGGSRTFAMENPIPYGSMLERGLYERPGPRTVKTNTGVYSTQAVEGVMKPLVIDSDVMVNLIVESVVKRMQSNLRSI